MKSGIGEHLSVLWMFRASSNISLHCLTLSWISIKVQAFRYFQKYSDFMFRAISNISPVSHPLLNIPIARDEAFKYFPKKFRFWREVKTMQLRMLVDGVDRLDILFTDTFTSDFTFNLTFTFHEILKRCFTEMLDGVNLLDIRCSIDFTFTFPKIHPFW